MGKKITRCGESPPPQKKNPSTELDGRPNDPIRFDGQKKSHDGAIRRGTDQRPQQQQQQQHRDDRNAIPNTRTDQNRAALSRKNAKHNGRRRPTKHSATAVAKFGETAIYISIVSSSSAWVWVCARVCVCVCVCVCACLCVCHFKKVRNVESILLLQFE